MWRSPLDTIALEAAHKMALRVPRCDYTFYQLPPLSNPEAHDIIPIWHPGQPGGRDYGISLTVLKEFFAQDVTSLFFDVEDFGAVPNADSTSAIQATVAAAYAAGGGTIVIKDSYLVSSPIALTDSGIEIWGLSPSSKLTMTASGDIFDISGAAGGNGLVISDLKLAYASTAQSGTAINIIDGENVRIENCYFENCPVAVDVRYCLQAVLINSTVAVTNREGAIGVILGGDYFRQTNVALVTNCIIRAFPGNTSCIGMVIGEAYQCHIASTTISTWATCVQFYPAPGVTPTHPVRSNFVDFNSCYMSSSGHCVLIRPWADADSQIIGASFNQCLFRRGDDTRGTFPLVLIETNGLPNSAVDTIIFANCLGFNATGAGILIKGGQSIQITGGRYSSNAQKAPAHGGISIDGNAQNVQIDGANLTGIFPDPDAHDNYPTQPFALTLANGAADVIVTACDMRNNAGAATSPISSPVLVDETVTNCTIRGCVGTAWEDVTAGAFGDTAYNNNGQDLFTIYVPAGAVLIGKGSTLLTYRGHIQSSVGGGTTRVWFGIGGKAQITLKGPFAVGDTITVTLGAVPVTVGVTDTTLSVIAAAIAGAINGQPAMSSSVTATAGTSPYGDTIVAIAAKPALWQSLTQTGQSVTTTSAQGTATFGSTLLISQIYNFSITDNESHLQFEGQMTASPGGGTGEIWDLSALTNPGASGGAGGVAAVVATTTQIDRELSAEIHIMMQATAGAGGDYIERSQFAYQRI